MLLVNKAICYDVKGRKYIDTPYKYYFTDIGIRNAQINLRQIEENHTVGNIIFYELLSCDFNVYVGLVTVNQRDSNCKNIRKQLEVDFVCN